MQRYLFDIGIAFEAILTNKLRSVLTGLGIIFGVAAVISMLAIGNGARQEILEQMKMVGVNNILITPIVMAEKENSDSKDQGANDKDKKKFSPGLTLKDVEGIREVIPTAKTICPEISLNSYVMQNGLRKPAKIIGVSKEYFELYNMPLEQGLIFDENQDDLGMPVCVIGANIRSRFFPKGSAINQHIKFGDIWLKVIGVLQKNTVTVSGLESTGINVQNDNIYIPVKTMLLRFQNRALVNSKKLQDAVMISNGYFMGIMSSDPSKNKSSNYHQLDRVVLQVKETEQLDPTTEILSRMLTRRHAGVHDFEITVPELLLKQQQRTKDIFNIVLGAIASISLIVGGIGIMNIMFASVMERIKEIGTRMAIGATKRDIVVQFLSEAVLISVTGGLIGVFLGIIISMAITRFANILSIVSLGSVVLSFFVSVSVGVIFGYSPAKRASEKDPIESLRYE
jgi:putative ABC transport system permease protein